MTGPLPDPLTRLRAALEGRYRIEREIGAGGMATVYLAQDPKHQRRVALKVLRPELAAIVGAERFLNEIVLTANLQHPNILPLYDSGEADGFLYYVMPYVEGETLRDRLSREGQLGLEEALAIAKSVAAALQHAHERNVIHRDIKPANILLQSGQALVADFGVALAVSQASGGRLTETGVSLGTPHYMSPEQAAGDRQLDARSDVYSLGAIVYEMLVGEPPHPGKTAQAILARILSSEPDPVTKHRPNVPAHVDAAIRRALSKTPADRFRSANEFVDALSGRVRFAATETTVNVRGSGRFATARWLASTVGVVLIAVVALRGWPQRAGEGQVVRTVIALPEDQRLGFGAGNSLPVVISPDGRTIVYVAELESGTQLMLRPIDAFEATPIPGTASATQPFFSPDGTQIGFLAGRALRRVGLDGGAPLTITRLDGSPHGASWGDDGQIVFSVDGVGLFGVPAGGGEPLAISLVSSSDGRPPGDTIRDTQWPQSLPGGTHVLFTSEQGVWLADLTTGEARLVVSASGVALSRYLHSGHVMYAEAGGAVRLLPFDPKRLTATGITFTPIDGVARGMAGGANAMAVSDNGTAVYAAGVPGSTLVLVDRNGRETPIPLELNGLRWPRLSPDGNQVVMPAGGRMYLVDLRRSGADPIPVGGQPVWSPDGERLVSKEGGTYSDLVEHRLDRLGEPRRIGPGAPPTSRFGFWLEDWSADGRRLIGVVQSFSGRSEIRVLELGQDSVPALVLETDGASFGGQWSPDGSHFTYMSDETGTFEVYVAGYPEAGRPVRVTSGGGQDPRWTDREIIYRNGHRIMVVDVRTDPALEFGEPRELFRADYNFHAGAENWDVTRDGQRFVMIKSDPAVTRELKVVVNWFAELSAAAAR